MGDFQDKINKIVSNKFIAYGEGDLGRGKSLLKEQIHLCSVFNGFLLKLIEDYKIQRKIWLIRALQQRYQLILRGVDPLIEELERLTFFETREKMLMRCKLLRNFTSSKYQWMEHLKKIRGAEKINKRFVDGKPRDEIGVPLPINYSDESEKGSETYEMHPHTDQEIKNIETELEGMIRDFRYPDLNLVQVKYECVKQLRKNLEKEEESRTIKNESNGII